MRRDKYRELFSRLDILERDVSDVKTRIADLHRTMDRRFDRVNERFDQMYERMITLTRWTVGTPALFGHDHDHPDGYRSVHLITGSVGLCSRLCPVLGRAPWN